MTFLNCGRSTLLGIPDDVRESAAHPKRRQMPIGVSASGRKLTFGALIQSPESSHHHGRVPFMTLLGGLGVPRHVANP